MGDAAIHDDGWVLGGRNAIEGRVNRLRRRAISQADRGKVLDNGVNAMVSIGLPRGAILLVVAEIGAAAHVARQLRPASGLLRGGASGIGHDGGCCGEREKRERVFFVYGSP